MFEIQSGAERWFVFARLRRPNPTKHAGRKLDVWDSNLFLINKRKQTLKRNINLSGKGEKQNMYFVMQNLGRVKSNLDTPIRLEIQSIYVAMKGHRRCLVVISCWLTARLCRDNCTRKIKEGKFKIGWGEGDIRQDDAFCFPIPLNAPITCNLSFG